MNEKGRIEKYIKKKKKKKKRKENDFKSNKRERQEENKPYHVHVTLWNCHWNSGTCLPLLERTQKGLISTHKSTIFQCNFSLQRVMILMSGFEVDDGRKSTNSSALA